MLQVSMPFRHRGHSCNGQRLTRLCGRARSTRSSPSVSGGSPDDRCSASSITTGQQIACVHGANPRAESGPAHWSWQGRVRLIVHSAYIEDFKGVQAVIPWASAIVLFGANDAGKTNVLEGLAFLTPDHDERQDPLSGSSGSNGWLVELDGMDIDGHADQLPLLLMAARICGGVRRGTMGTACRHPAPIRRCLDRCPRRRCRRAVSCSGASRS